MDAKSKGRNNVSYDLVFWKQSKKKLALGAQRIYEQLVDGKSVNGLETIPAAEFIGRIRKAFPGIKTEGGLTYWEGNERGMFELYSSDQHVHCCCRQLTADDMNKLIEIASEFECPLYDPQVNQRFDG